MNENQRKVNLITDIELYKDSVDIEDQIQSVNYHLTKICNYWCTYCFAHFNKISKRLSKKESFLLINILKDAGTKKITFVGGEPTLISYLPELVIHAKEHGLTTMVVTNGSRINSEYLKLFDGKLDWMSISLDTGREFISKQLGRGNGDHVEQSLKVVKLLQDNQIKIKINTVVTALTYNEDMNWVIDLIKPTRWKVFQVLPISGENDIASDLFISKEDFEIFLENHRENNPVSENNDNMINSYVMIDPEGRFFSNDNNYLNHTVKILDVGVKEAFLSNSFNYTKFIARGGKYEW